MGVLFNAILSRDSFKEKFVICSHNNTLNKGGGNKQMRKITWMKTFILQNAIEKAVHIKLFKYINILIQPVDNWFKILKILFF